jgi:hypothetical protein
MDNVQKIYNSILILDCIFVNHCVLAAYAACYVKHSLIHFKIT